MDGAATLPGTDVGMLPRGLELHPHPAHPPLGVTAIAVTLAIADGQLLLDYRAEGAGWLVWPPDTAGRQRRDELWRTTCFELFIAGPDGEGYREFNFAPSGDWAAYDFASRRRGRSDVAITAPPLITARAGARAELLAAVALADLPPLPWRLGLSAIIAETGGAGGVRASYWALAHPVEGPADFHHPDCFHAQFAETELS